MAISKQQIRKQSTKPRETITPEENLVVKNSEFNVSVSYTLREKTLTKFEGF